MGYYIQQYYALAGQVEAWRAKFKAAGLNWPVDEILDLYRPSPTLTFFDACEKVYQRMIREGRV